MPGAADAQQQQNCAPAIDVVSRLAEKYGEQQLTGGFVGNRPSHILVMFANAETGTWTALEMTPEGMACVVSYGEGWMEMAPSDPAQKGDPL
jgi:hypothetical protein